MDPHRNVFFYYGVNRRGDKVVWDTQLENNVTKAFVNCLELATDSLLPPLLRLLAIRISGKGPIRQADFGLQSLPKGATFARHRYPVVITGKEQKVA